jgi:hypothetical protein
LPRSRIELPSPSTRTLPSEGANRPAISRPAGHRAANVKEGELEWAELASSHAKADQRGVRCGGAIAAAPAGTRVLATDRQEPPLPHLDAINHSLRAAPERPIIVPRKAMTKPSGGRERLGRTISTLTLTQREATVSAMCAD